VDKSADITVAAKRVAWGAFMNAGQTCVRPDYLLVHQDIADAVVKKMKQSVRDMYGQDPQQSEWFGRLINGRAWDRVADIVNNCKDNIAWGGNVDKDDKYIEPTLLDFGTDESAFAKSAAMKEEIFGPILPMLRYSSLDQVIAFIRAREKPLSCYCFTTNSRVRERVLSETSSGSCDINDVIMHMTNEHLPFGGVGMSGMGGYHGKRSFDSFSHRKSVLMKTNHFDLPQRYPPYSSSDAAILKLVQTPRPAKHFRMLKLFLIVLVLALLYYKRQSIKAMAGHLI